MLPTSRLYFDTRDLDFMWFQWKEILGKQFWLVILQIWILIGKFSMKLHTICLMKLRNLTSFKLGFWWALCSSLSATKVGKHLAGLCVSEVARPQSRVAMGLEGLRLDLVGVAISNLIWSRLCNSRINSNGTAWLQARFCRWPQAKFFLGLWLRPLLLISSDQ